MSNTNSLEYAYEPVPKDKRMKLPALILVLAGYPIALSNFVIGGLIGINSTYIDAITAILIGNSMLIAIVILMGILACKYGIASSFLARRAFGQKGSLIFSMLIFLSCLTWMAVNGDIFGNLMVNLFSWWPLPASVTAVIVVFLWLISAMKGAKGLAIMASFGVPAALICAVVGFISVGNTDGGYGSVFNFIPDNQMTFTAATASIVGGWVVGATITSDFSRFAQKPTHVVIGGITSFIVGGMGFQLVGTTVAISTGESDFIAAMIALGLGILAFFVAVFCLWTTQDKDIYAGSLAIQNMIKDTKLSGRLTHKHTSLIFVVLTAVLAASGVFNFLLPIIQFLSVLIPPVVGVVLIEGFFIKSSKENIVVNRTAIIAWIVGGLVSYLSLTFNFFISPLIGIITASIVYLVLEKVKSAKQVKAGQEELDTVKKAV
ncbi:purine-cytosine permease family protein [Gracilibacillus phocaeensis]|uniref:purine-cytosine permease family protein n=1 Tax=Gracilibacillus phocaeensis TaxID=2042304 RepID=UPI00102F52A3|nr:cytosine permease [Gracilibacillus phocaeensis]